MNIKNLIPAFPTWINDDAMAQGMSLRDYFAAMALTSLLNDDLSRTLDKQEGMDWAAKTAYKIADTMMEHRK